MRLGGRTPASADGGGGLGDRGSDPPGSVTFIVMSMSRFCVPARRQGIRDEPGFYPDLAALLLGVRRLGVQAKIRARTREGVRAIAARDRKSTRLNSSHSQISYAVFCLKKKNQHLESAPLFSTCHA